MTLFMYEEAFRLGHLGYGAAVAWIVLLLTFVLAALGYAMTRRGMRAAGAAPRASGPRWRVERHLHALPVSGRRAAAVRIPGLLDVHDRVADQRGNRRDPTPVPAGR